MQTILVIALFACILAITLGCALWDGKRAEAHERKRRADAQRRELFLTGCVMGQIVKYEDSLIRTLAQSRYRDAYGDWVHPRWPKELDYFFKNKVAPLLPDDVTPAELKELQGHLDWWVGEVEWDLYEAEGEQRQALDGIGYERQVGAALSRLGCDITYTPASGDQGVDLIATFKGLRTAVQCKNYSGPVGNAAVQEVFAGGKFYGAARFIVVAPNGFTTAARQLASSLRVECLHHDELAAAFASTDAGVIQAG